MYELTGLSACPGSSRGPGRVVRGLNPDITRFPEGGILVVSFSTPMLYPFFLKAAAVVAEFGGITCHAASLSREIGIPCVVGVESITSLVENGDILTVDGALGTVIIEREKPNGKY